jgi:O-antigen/teichoic acid export membrane protein
LSAKSTECLGVVAAETPVQASPLVPYRFSARRAYAQTFTATITIRLMGVVSGVLAARLLGPTGRGELAVIIFLPLLLISVGELELPRSLACEVSKLDEVPPKVVATGFWLAALLSVAQAAALAIVLPHYLPADKAHLLTASKAFMLYLPASLITFALAGIDQGRGRFGRFSLLLALPGIVYVVAIGVLWLGDFISPMAFALGILAGAVVTAVTRITMDWRTILHFGPDWTIASRVLKRGFGFYVPALASFLLARADMFLLVRLVPTTAIGLYAAAQAIALGQIGAITPFVQVGFAAVANQFEPQQAYETLLRHFRVAQVTMIGAGLATGVVTPWIIRVLFGVSFVPAVPTAYLLIAAAGLWGMEQVLEQGLRAASHPRPGIISNLLGLTVLVGIGIPACLRLGINGLAAVVLLAQFVNLMSLIVLSVAALRIPVRRFWALDGDMVRDLLALGSTLIRRYSEPSPLAKR